MASVTPDGSATLFVAVHAGNHRGGYFFSKDDTFSHGTVTNFACNFGVLEMHFVGEVDVVWYSVHAYPRHWLVLVMILG